ncbi:MAG TPA: aminotransferase class I/II-fold pyridoxal phosphate-dependent enzyme [Polyangia bacterium]|jgi:cystathionine beta-lyase/cystathionine gamma-synthase|nr:aminotransferase class I/II-fold pyridoxal phosphate-dependent enzyme [Polyangia bacterium]
MKRRGTLCAHAGEHAPGIPAGIKPHAPPIFQSSGFEYPSHAEAEAAGRGEVYIYSRDANPTEDRLAHAIAELEMTEDACIFSSGMGAISAALLAYVGAGAHVVSIEGLYGVTHAFLTEHLARFGATCTLVGAPTPDAIDAAITPETRVVYLESITNPLLRVCDVDGIAAVCRARGVPLVVDATFATPLLQRPIERGAILSVHSATKYISGHGDLLLGVVSGPKSEIQKVRKLRKLTGGNADPFAAWLALRGLRTMALRVERQVATALTVAHALEHVDGVERVHHPSLPSHPDHEIAARVLDGGGAMVSFEVAGGLSGARRCYDRLRLVARAASLGDVTSLMTHPATFSHNRLSDIERRRFGITDGLLRLSVGIEDAGDLVDDLRQALG